MPVETYDTDHSPPVLPQQQICHVCHHPNAKLKRERWWTCPRCRARHERNHNAAVNLGRLTLPPGRGPMLRDGKALAGAPGASETGSVETENSTAHPLGMSNADCVFTS